MYTAYVIKSTKSGTLYIGQTKNLVSRLNDHNEGRSKYTKNRGPWRIVYSVDYKTRSEAMSREKYLKTGAGRDFLRSVIK